MHIAPQSQGQRDSNGECWQVQSQFRWAGCCLTTVADDRRSAPSEDFGFDAQDRAARLVPALTITAADGVIREMPTQRPRQAHETAKRAAPVTARLCWIGGSATGARSSDWTAISRRACVLDTTPAIVGLDRSHSAEWN